MRANVRVVAAAAVFSSATFAAQAQQAVQWRVEDAGNGHWYQVVTVTSGQLCWSAAQAAAEGSGAHLATVNRSGEQAFLISRLAATGAWQALIGGIRLPSSDYVSGWTWATGEPFQPSVVQWASGNPGCCDTGEYWLGLRGNGLHDLLECTTSVMWEWSADCNNDGIVDYGQCRNGSLPDFNGNNIPDCCETGTPCVVGNYPVQWREADGGNGHWYAIGPNYQTQSAARAYASARGGHLALLDQLGEQQFCLGIAGFPQGDNGTWIGMRLDASTWRWDDGQPVGPTIAWLPGNPCTPCDEPAALLIRQSQWGTGVADSSDPHCCSPYPATLVEWSADCNNDGIVDYGQVLSGHLADTNGDGIPNTCQCPGDVTGNNAVDGVDLAIVLSAWATNGNGEFQTDIDGDGLVGGTDLAYVLGGWGPCQ